MPKRSKLIVFIVAYEAEWANATLPGLFAYQIFMEARPSATVDALLDDAIRASPEKAGPAAEEAGTARAS